MLEHKVAIVGGGLAGLTLSILLKRIGYDVDLYERKSYPFHRVCGEYISNEVQDLIKHLEIDLSEHNVSNIQNLKVTDTKNNVLEAKLDLGGFGISRYLLDDLLYKKAVEKGVNFYLNTKVRSIDYNNQKDNFKVESDAGEQIYNFVIASFGKRSTLDTVLNRAFIKKRSPYLAVKYHIKLDFPHDLIQLDNFENGYCGISKIEEDKYCMCYLSHRDNLKNYKSIPEMEKNILFKNKFIKNHFESAEFLYEEPLVINEISFEKKNLIENHVLFCGDAAGMITPLCGNGMSMAMHAAYILSKSFEEFKFHKNRSLLENTHKRNWELQFNRRIYWGLKIQNLFGNLSTTAIALKMLNKSGALKNYIISLTHGKNIKIT